jgi:hypothetical protein
MALVAQRKDLPAGNLKAGQRQGEKQNSNAVVTVMHFFGGGSTVATAISSQRSGELGSALPLLFVATWV